MKERELMAVYGTLRNGHGNWQWALSSCPLTETGVRLDGYEMRVSSGIIPAIFEVGTPAASVVVDVFDITDLPEQTLQRIDRMEFACGYERRQARLRSGEIAWVYVMPADRAAYWPNVVASGNWEDIR